MNPPTVCKCINLAEKFGRRFRVEHEESYFAESPEFRAAEEVSLQIIPCRRGHIYPWTGSILAAYKAAGSTARKLAKLSFVTVYVDASDGTTLLFDVAHFEEVAKLMHPRKCRRLSPEQRARLSTMGAKYRFKHGVQTRPEPRVCVPKGPAGLGPVPDAAGVSEAFPANGRHSP